MSQPTGAKLGYSFEELCFWYFKPQLLSRSTVDFLLYVRQLISEDPRKGTLLLFLLRAGIERLDFSGRLRHFSSSRLATVVQVVARAEL